MLLHEITLKNLLSFGPDGVTLPLLPLNVLIGPNGSGKSNLIEAISLLQAAPRDITAPIRKGGDIDNWFHKVERRLRLVRRFPIATLVVSITGPPPSAPLNYVLQFYDTFHCISERIAKESNDQNETRTLFLYIQDEGNAHYYTNPLTGESSRVLINDKRSVLAQFRDPVKYPEITFISTQFERIRLYRKWSFGRFVVSRLEQPCDYRDDELNEDCSNLGGVLCRLWNMGISDSLRDNLRQLYSGIEGFYFREVDGIPLVYVMESGDREIPATRLSDGTLRYLCLLAVLCNPNTGPLICLEEPELGMHPDIIPTIARLLKEASKRTQLIVTTHSDILIDELSEDPESVVVCEKENGQTTMKRLDSPALSEWLEKYRLGQLWTKGELGGVRW